MASTQEMISCFDDGALLRAALLFERELAGAQAEAGVIPDAAAVAIAAACDRFAADGLAELAAHAGTLAIPLVARLRESLGDDAEAARWVHFGATSQDLADTALTLQARDAIELIEGELVPLASALAALAQCHVGTPVLGRTLLQPAQTVTFGARVANWLLGLDAAHERLRRESRAGLRAQLGGAVGTLAPLGGSAERVGDALARRLGLAPSLSWHSRRDGVVAIGAALGIVIGAIGKIARDVSLLMQAELAEVAEPRIAGRGGSSAMAHKHNATGCQVALSAAIRAPGLVASLLAGMPQEHERGLGGWQAEAPVLAQLFELAHGAIRATRIVAEGLETDPDAMRARLSAALGEGAADEASLAAGAAYAERALELHQRFVTERARER